MVGTLDHVAAGARAERRQEGGVVLEHGEHENSDVRMTGDQLLGRLDPAETRQVQIHDHHVRFPRRRRPASASSPMAGLADHVDPPSTSAEGPSSPSCVDGVVVAHDNPQPGLARHVAASGKGSSARTRVPGPAWPFIVKQPAELVGALAHRGQADAGRLSPARTRAVIADLDDRASVLQAIQPAGDAPRARMVGGVRQRFQSDPLGGDLGGRGQAWLRVGDSR